MGSESLPLFDSTPLEAPLMPAGTTHEARARLFHERNPQVMKMAIDLAVYARRRGAKRYGMKAIWEILRFRALETSGDKYKLNNSYTAWYAREIMATVPSLQGFLTTRESPHDEAYHDR